MPIYSLQPTMPAPIMQQKSEPPLLSAEERALTKGIYSVEQLTADEIELIKDLSNWKQAMCSGSGVLSEEMIHRILESYKDKTETLDLSGLGLGSAPLPYDAFSRMTHLKNLILSDNQLTHLDPKLFENLRNLESLNLSRNQLTNLDPKLFENLRNLESLRLSRNQLTNLDPKLFENLSNLKKLSLSYNRLTQLNSALFENLVNLTDLNIAVDYKNQPLPELDRELIHRFEKLECLRLFNGRYCFSVTTSVIENLVSLKELTQSENKAIQSYTGYEGFSELNTEAIPTEKSLQILDSNLRNAIAKLSRNKKLIKTFRGGRYVDGFSNSMQWKTNKFFSTSKNASVAHGFAATKNGAFIVIFGQSGADINQLSNAPYEDEVVYNKDIEFQLLLRQKYSDVRRMKNGSKIKYKKYQVIEEAGLPIGTGSTYKLVDALDLAKQNPKKK